MKVAIIYNKDLTDVINRFGMQNNGIYNPKTVRKVADVLEKGGHNVRIAEGDMYIVERLKEFMSGVIEGERAGMQWTQHVPPLWRLGSASRRAAVSAGRRQCSSLQGVAEVRRDGTAGGY